MTECVRLNSFGGYMWSNITESIEISTMKFVTQVQGKR